jgi:hypothetical protein
MKINISTRAVMLLVGASGAPYNITTPLPITRDYIVSIVNKVRVHLTTFIPAVESIQFAFFKQDLESGGQIVIIALLYFLDVQWR